jgi:hypothetical protein
MCYRFVMLFAVTNIWKQCSSVYLVLHVNVDHCAADAGL